MSLFLGMDAVDIADATLRQFYISFLGVYLVVLFAILLYQYILTAMALQRMGTTCHLPRPWLAWIPVVSIYALGAVADQDAVQKGQPRTHFRRHLLGLTLACLGLCIAVITAAISLAVYGVLHYGMAESGQEGTVQVPEMSAGFGISIALMVILISLVLTALVIALLVFEYMAIWRIFKLFTPDNAVAFLLICIFLSIAQPILLFLASREVPPVMQAPPASELRAQAGG